MEIVAERRIGDTEVRAVRADITTLDVDAIVNAANEQLSHGGGVAAAIAKAGGPGVQDESEDWVRAHGPLRNGRAAVTTAGWMPARRVIHVVGPRYREGQENEGMLRAAVVAALGAAAAEGADRVAIPAVSAGVFGYPPEEATEVIASSVVQWLRMHPIPNEVLLVGWDREMADRFATALGSV